jgi:hypothetical protein
MGEPIGRIRGFHGGIVCALFCGYIGMAVGYSPVNVQHLGWERWEALIRGEVQHTPSDAPYVSVTTTRRWDLGIAVGGFLLTGSLGYVMGSLLIWVGGLIRGDRGRAFGALLAGSLAGALAGLCTFAVLTPVANTTLFVFPTGAAGYSGNREGLSVVPVILGLFSGGGVGWLATRGMLRHANQGAIAQQAE